MVKQLKQLGFNCENNVCDKDNTREITTENSYFSYGNIETFDLNEKKYTIHNVELRIENNQVLKVENNWFTYNWETEKEYSENEYDNGQHYIYNCKTAIITIPKKSIFELEKKLNCNSLSIYEEEYDITKNQCKKLKEICISGRTKKNHYDIEYN